MLNENSIVMQNQYYYNPATRFQQNFTNPLQGQAISTAGQFGTLGYNPNYQQSQYNNPYCNWQYGYCGQQNPYGYNYNQQYNNPISQYVDKTVYVDGYNPSNNMYLMTDDLEKKMDDIAKKMCEEQETMYARQRQMMNSNPYNYYGYINQGYMNPYTLSKYRSMQEKVLEEAKEKRVEFNKMLSRASRKYLGMEVDEEEIDSIYDKKSYTIPAENIKESYQMAKLEYFTVNNNTLTKERYNTVNNVISEEHNKIINPNSNLAEFLENAGRLLYEIEFEKLQEEKRDKTNNYNTTEYSRYLDEQVYKRDGKLPESMFPTLSNTSSILEDGTISIKCPDWIKKDVQENQYEIDRQKFIQSIYNS